MMSNFQHKSLAAGRWKKMTLVEQMANIGSEVFRAIKWKNKNNSEHSQKAFFRALELLDLSLVAAEKYPRLKEIARVREALVDYFHGDNIYKSTDAQWEKYFYAFTYAAQKQRGKI